MNWDKKNHGGSPTGIAGKKRAVFIGRYQPYHHGHTNLIRQKLDQGIPVLIMVRDIEPDEKNPFTTGQTVSMIRKYHAAMGDDAEVLVIPDIESVNYGRGVGYEINEYTPPDEIGFISATKIRESVKAGNDEWRSMVDESIQDDVINFMGLSDKNMIKQIKWGAVEMADGSTYKDAKIWPGGSREWDWRVTGTKHRPGIQVADIQEILDNGAEYVVLSSGYECMLETTIEAELYLQSLHVPYEIYETGAAADRYNELCKDGIMVGALIHSTC